MIVDAETETTWRQIPVGLYHSLYATFSDALVVHGTHTCGEGGCEFHSNTYVLTEWGFKGAAHALIRSIRDERMDSVWTYWIAEVVFCRS